MRYKSWFLLAVFWPFGWAANAQAIQFDFNDFGDLTDTANNSPAHATGDLGVSDTTWNGVRASGSVASLNYTDGSSATGISVEVGLSPDASSPVTWGALPNEARDDPWNGNGGVYASNMGWDRITTIDNKKLGVRVTGLAPGTYKVFVVSRASATISSADESFNASIGVNLGDITGTQPALGPWLGGSPNYGAWVNGQTYLAATVTTTSSSDYISTVVQGVGTGFESICSLQGLQIVSAAPSPLPASSLIGDCALVVLMWLTALISLHTFKTGTRYTKNAKG